MDNEALTFAAGQAKELTAVLAKTEFSDAHQKAVDAILGALNVERSRYSNLKTLIADAKVQHRAELEIFFLISEYEDDDFDPVFDIASMPDEAKATLALLKSAKESLELIQERSRLWIKEIQDEPLSNLDKAIAFFSTHFPAPRHKQPNRRLYDALNRAVRVFETLTGRRFRRNLERDYTIESFSNPDARVLFALMQAIDPSLTAATVGSALQKNFRQNPKNHRQKN